MNKPHITDEQVDKALTAYWGDDYGQRNKLGVFMRKALEAAFPEQQPAAFTKLVVTEEMAQCYWVMYGARGVYGSAEMGKVLQLFTDKHSIKPLSMDEWTKKKEDWIQDHWRDGAPYEAFSALCPPPEPAVDAKESAWYRYCKDSIDPFAHQCDGPAFKAGYEAAQAGGNRSDSL
jgi:hypothetical protein